MSHNEHRCPAAKKWGDPAGQVGSTLHSSRLGREQPPWRELRDGLRALGPLTQPLPIGKPSLLQTAAAAANHGHHRRFALAEGSHLPANSGRLELAQAEPDLSERMAAWRTDSGSARLELRAVKIIPLQRRTIHGVIASWRGGRTYLRSVQQRVPVE